MSWDISLYATVDGNRLYIDSWNYTHNCNDMIREAGIPDWPGDFLERIIHAERLAIRLEEVVKDLESKPDHYCRMNPPNGWGDYDGLLRVLHEILATCRKFPSATVEGSY